MGVRRCLARSLTSLALLRTPKSANGPRSNSFRPDSPTQPTSHGDGRLSQPLTTPDMVRSGRVLHTSVKSPFRSKNNRTAQTIIYRKYVVARQGSLSPEVGDNQRPERTMSGVRKPPPESSVPGENLPREVGGINCGGDMGVRRCLARSLTSLALLRTPKSANGPRKEFIPAGFPSTTNFPRGRKTQPAPSPHRTWSVPDASLHTSVKSPLNLAFRHPPLYNNYDLQLKSGKAMVEIIMQYNNIVTGTFIKDPTVLLPMY